MAAGRVQVGFCKLDSLLEVGFEEGTSMPWGWEGCKLGVDVGVGEELEVGVVALSNPSIFIAEGFDEEVEEVDS